MTRTRTREDARRLEQQLVLLRWVVAAFGAVQVGFAIRDRPKDPAFEVPLGVALVVALALGNLVISNAVRRADDRQLRVMAVLAFVLDAAVILSLIWLTTDSTADPVWVVGYLLPLEGAARWGLAGAFIGAGVFLGGQVVGEVGTAARASIHAGWPAIAFRAAMAFIVGVVAGSFAASSRRAAQIAEARAEQLEEAAQRAEAAAALEDQARGEVAAFHAAALTDPDMERLGQTLQTTADAIGAELGCDGLGVLVRDHGIAGEVGFQVLGVHGNPGYVRGERLFPASDPVAAAAMEGQPVLAPPDVVAPMRVRGEVVGALHERADGGPAPDAERVSVLSGLADQLGLVLESARMRADQESTVHRLRELDEMKSDFIAITSHELRTPLSGIRGFVDMLRRRGDELGPVERDEYLGIVLGQTDRLIRLVDDLLIVTRVEAGKLSLEPGEVEIRPLLEQIVRGIGDTAERVRIDEAPEAPERIVVDPNRLIQVLTNLVHNATKFSPPDTEVLVRWRAPAEGTVAFDVIDRGGGIPGDDLERIFDRFQQRESSMAHAEGFGLGLYITKLLTEAMGGWVNVSSEMGVGSTFTVTLPSARSLPAPARPSATVRSD
ncbi:MAG TPA: ATP-binding protein [Actinomycetota bacterium]|nr:ATP-binding protein [Actinomycetota bacterium]